MGHHFSGLSRAILEQSCQHLQRRVVEHEKALANKDSELAVKDSELVEKDAQLAALEADRKDLADRLALLQHELFGRKSEKTDQPIAGQETLLGAPVEIEEDAPAPEPLIDVNALPDDEDETEKKSSPRESRKPAPEIAREEVIIRVPEEERVGPNGERLVSNGFEVTETLHHIPQRLLLLVIKREKLAVADTREYVCTAPPQPRLIPGAKVSDDFMLHVTLQKYVMGLPLHRQLQQYNLLGANLADNYLGECVRHIAGAFEPIAAAIREQVLAASWVFADETTIKQLKDADKAVRTAYLWAWVGNKQVSFHYGRTRSANEVRDQLGIPYDPDDPDRDNNDHDPESWEQGSLIGFLICDRYSGYHPVFRSGDIIRVGCWVHARRRFHQMRERDRNAARVTAAINAIFRADKKIRKAADKKRLPENSDQRHRFIAEQRQAHLPSLIAELDQLLSLIAPYYTPDSVIGKAITYIRNAWDDLQVFLEHGFLPMENNTAERAVRPIAVGRKAWLFVGSEDGGQWAATMFSIIESCRLQKIDPRQYCEEIIDHIVQAPDRTKIDYDQLTPAAWRKKL